MLCKLWWIEWVLICMVEYLVTLYFNERLQTMVLCYEMGWMLGGVLIFVLFMLPLRL